MSMQPPPDTDEPLDREERELAALYRQLPGSEPDAALDARILAQAQGAVARKPRRYRHLLVGFGSFSALAMAAGLTWHLYLNGNGHLPRAPASAPPAALHAPAAPPSNDVVRFRILSDSSQMKADGAVQRQASPSPKLYGKLSQLQSAPPMASKTVPAKPPMHDKSLVVPVRIIPESRDTRDMGGYGAVPPPAAHSGGHVSEMARAASTQPATVPASILIEQARQALTQHDEALARQRVLELVRAYPNQPVPADLSQLAPGSP